MRHFPICSVLMSLTACLGLSVTAQASASTYTVSIFQSGSNVVATGSGSLSVSGSIDSGTALMGVQANAGYLVLGSGENEAYGGVSGPSSFGSGALVAPTSSTGGEVGLGFNFNEYVVPFGYVAGSALSASDTWNNTTLSGLGLNAGSYTYTLGSGDKFIINIGSSTSATPEPGSIVLLGTGMLGLAGAVRKRLA